MLGKNSDVLNLDTWKTMLSNYDITWDTCLLQDNLQTIIKDVNTVFEEYRIAIAANEDGLDMDDPIAKKNEGARGVKRTLKHIFLVLSFQLDVYHTTPDTNNLRKISALQDANNALACCCQENPELAVAKLDLQRLNGDAEYVRVLEDLLPQNPNWHIIGFIKALTRFFLISQVPPNDQTMIDALNSYVKKDLQELVTAQPHAHTNDDKPSNPPIKVSNFEIICSDNNDKKDLAQIIAELKVICDRYSFSKQAMFTILGCDKEPYNCAMQFKDGKSRLQVKIYPAYISRAASFAKGHEITIENKKYYLPFPANLFINTQMQELLRIKKGNFVEITLSKKSTAPAPLENTFWSQPAQQSFYQGYIHPYFFEYIQQIAAKKNGPVTVFEIGGGDGALAEKILAGCAAVTTYLFTEPNTLFETAATRLQKFNTMETQRVICKQSLASANFSELFGDKPRPNVFIASGVFTQTVMSKETAEESFANVLSYLADDAFIIISGLRPSWLTHAHLEKQQIQVYNTSCFPHGDPKGFYVGQKTTVAPALALTLK